MCQPCYVVHQDNAERPGSRKTPHPHEGRALRLWGLRGAQVPGVPSFLSLRSEPVRPSDFLKVKPAEGRSIRRAGLSEGRDYPASTRKGGWGRARVLVSVGKPLPQLVCGPVPEAQRRPRGESAHPPGFPHRSPLGGGGSALSSVWYLIDPSRRRGSCALVEAGWERRGARHSRSPSALGPGPLGSRPSGGPGDPAVARSSAGARGAGKAGSRSSCAPLWSPTKMNKGRLQPTNGPPKSPGTPTQGTQTLEDCREGHLSYTRGHHCVHSSHSPKL